MILKTLLIVTFFWNLTNSEYLPVLIWDSSSPAVSVFQKISSTDFMKSITSDDIHESMIITFIDDLPDVSDYSKCKLNSGDKCFSNLSQMKKKLYYANVENPIDTLRNSDLKKQYAEVNENGELDEPIDFEKGKIAFITFAESLDDEQNRSKILHKRDGIINKIYKELSVKGKTIGIYTGKQNHISKRVVRQVSNEKQKQQQDEKQFYAFNVDNKFFIYYKYLSYLEGKENRTIKIISTGIDNVTANSFEVKLNGENNINIKFHVNIESGYWKAINFTYQDTLLKSEYIVTAAVQFSYYCGDVQMTDNENKFKLYWKHLQLEPIFNKTNDGSFRFSDAWHCIGFTSIGIWSGLFVTFMMLGIFTLGIIWLMDIRTMDRFDDAKGKTITITASD